MVLETSIPLSIGIPMTTENPRHYRIVLYVKSCEPEVNPQDWDWKSILDPMPGEDIACVGSKEYLSEIEARNGLVISPNILDKDMQA